jgi:hypothetical protein
MGNVTPEQLIAAARPKFPEARTETFEEDFSFICLAICNALTHNSNVVETNSYLAQVKAYFGDWQYDAAAAISYAVDRLEKNGVIVDRLEKGAILGAWEVIKQWLFFAQGGMEAFEQRVGRA